MLNDGDVATASLNDSLVAPVPVPTLKSVKEGERHRAEEQHMNPVSGGGGRHGVIARTNPSANWNEKCHAFVMARNTEDPACDSL